MRCLLIHVSVASYAVPVRQYRSLPVGFLHCYRYQQPVCHLLILPSVTLAHKGLTPYGIISCYTFTFNNKNLYFKHFLRVSGKCAHAGHTHIIHSTVVSVQTFNRTSRTNFVRTRTEKQPVIHSQTYNLPLY